jgi:4-carboxymuconolactone decarboxylase
MVVDIKRYEDVHVAFARSGAPFKKDIARAMGMRAETFSIHIRHQDAKVSPAWSKRFNDAWEKVKGANAPADATVMPVHNAYAQTSAMRSFMPSSGSGSASSNLLRGTVPKLADLLDQLVYGDIWERPELSKRDRSLITVAALTALYRSDQLPGHISRALDNGVTREEIAEVITHMSLYAGMPVSVTAGRIAREVFEERG